MNKYAIFSLSELDESYKDSALILSGMFKFGEKKLDIENNDENLKENIQLFDDTIIRELASRFASVHYYAKLFSYDNLDYFAGKKSFLGSCLKFIYNTTKCKTNNLKDLIISIIENYY